VGIAQHPRRNDAATRLPSRTEAQVIDRWQSNQIWMTAIDVYLAEIIDGAQAVGEERRHLTSPE
jgi:hypothetical protein